MPRLRSGRVTTFDRSGTSKKLGQPQFESYFSADSKRVSPQTMHRYEPSAWLSQ
jgi:hypothetical protein